MLQELTDYKYFLIVDLEATCSEDDSISRNEMETIEIGAVIVDSDTLSTIDEFVTFIRPVRNSQLSKFCKELTSIKQGDVELAPPFFEAIEAFKIFLAPYGREFAFCSWGEFDRLQLERDCNFHDVINPLGASHFNLKSIFSQNQGRKKQYGMAKALRISGLEIEGVHHRGIDDARNLVRLLPFILGRKTI